MPPVCGSPIYIDPEYEVEQARIRTLAKHSKWPSKKRKITLRENEHEGYQLWCSFEKVVILDENVRFESDPEWGKHLDLARKGVWSDEFIDIINERLLPPDGLKWERLEFREAYNDVVDELLGGRNAQGHPDGSNPVFVTPDNETRLKLINTYTSYLADALPKGHYLSNQDINHIMSLSHTQTADLPAYIDLITGMPIVVTLNINGKQGIANGTFGHVHSVQFPENTRFKLVTDSGTGITVLVPNQPPMVVLLRVHRDPKFPPMPKVAGYLDLPDDIYPVFMMAARKSVQVTLTPSIGGEKRKVRIGPTQLPFVNAIASTVYKVQGETLTSLVVANFCSQSRPGHPKKNQWQQAYIILSRVVNRKAIALLKPFKKEFAKLFRPDNAVLKEDQELHKLCNKFLSSDEVRSMFSEKDYRPVLPTSDEDLDTNTTVSDPGKIWQEPQPSNLLERIRLQQQKPTSLLERIRASKSSNNKHHNNNSIKFSPASTYWLSATTSATITYATASKTTAPVSSTASTAAGLSSDNPIDVESIETDNIQPGELERALNYLLTPCEWLNDSAIDFHLKMITERHLSNQVKYLSSHFYTHLTVPSFSYQRVQNWMTKLGIFHGQVSCPSLKLFIPVHCNGYHWVLSFIDFTHQNYGYYDSFQRHCDGISNALLNLLIEEHRHHSPDDNFNASLWKDLDSIPGPTQTNGYDCGVFISVAARHLLTHDDLSGATFHTRDMLNWRQTIAQELTEWHANQLSFQEQFQSFQS